MRKFYFLFSIFVAAMLLIATSCKKDKTSLFPVNEGGIAVENFTDADLGFLFSIDGGTTWAETVPALSEGSVVMVKVSNGSDLTTADYSFDWSASIPVPIITSTAIATFTVGQEALSVKVSIFELVGIGTGFIGVDYSGNGILGFVFSTDDGTNWSASAPSTLNKGDKVQVKVTDGSNYLSTDEFKFDWSASSPTPSNATDAVVEFTIVDKGINVITSVFEIDELVVVRRADGGLYTVNKTTGDLTLVCAIVDDEGTPISGLRSLEYNPATGNGFIGSANSNNGNFYSVNLATGVTTLLNDNLNQDSREGISGVLMASDGNVLVNIYSNDVDNSAIAKFNATTGTEGTHYAFNDGFDLFSPGGLINGANSNEVIIGGEDEIYFSDLQGVVSETISLTPSTNISASMYVMDLARDNDTGIIYCLINDYSDTEYLYLATVNLTTGAITEIKQLADDTKSDWYHCLAFIPKHILSQLAE